MNDAIPSLEVMQQAARWRGVFPPFPENVSKEDLLACAKYRGIEVTGDEDEAELEQMLTINLGATEGL